MKKYFTIRTGMLPTNTYVFFETDTRACVVIDPAYNALKVLDFIKGNSLELQGILLTHGHFDHCGGVAQLLEYKNVGVYGSSYDDIMARNASKNQWGAHALDCRITYFVDGLNKLKIGDFEFEIMETPGHTDGSVCYFCEEVMFSGDTLFDGCIGRTDLPGGDIIKMRNSLMKINNLTFDYIVLPGHESATTLFEQKQCNPYLKSGVLVDDYN